MDDGGEAHLNPFKQSRGLFSFFFPGLLLRTISAGRNLMLFLSRA